MSASKIIKLMKDKDLTRIGQEVLDGFEQDEHSISDLKEIRTLVPT